MPFLRLLENSTRFPEIIDLYEEVLLHPFRAGWVPILPGDYVQGQRNSPENQETPEYNTLNFGFHWNYIEKDFMKDHDVPGVSIAIAKDGKLVFAKGYGMADRSKGELAGAKACFALQVYLNPLPAQPL